jgi:hypothetical protein
MRLIKDAISVIFGLLGWIVFGILWWWAFSRTSFYRQEILNLAGIVLFSFIVLIVSLLWVRYNVWLYRRRRWTGSRQPESTGYDYSTDTQRLPVTADFEALAKARYIVIELDESGGLTKKVYRQGDSALSPEERAVCEI